MENSSVFLLVKLYKRICQNTQKERRRLKNYSGSADILNKKCEEISEIGSFR